MNKKTHLNVLDTPELIEPLRAIEIQFTQQMLAYEQQAGALTAEQQTHLELASLLVNMALGKGQTCLALNAIAWLTAYPALAQRWQQYSLSDVKNSLSQAATVYDVSSHAPYANQPLVLSQNNLYLARYYFYEQQVLAQINAKLRLDDSINLHELQQILEGLFPRLETGIDWQKIAAASACLQKFAVITGGPGTGKTTTVTKLLSALLSLNPDLSIALAAPTGKAAARMTESIREAKGRASEGDLPYAERIPDSSNTLHRLLRWTPRGFRYRAGQHLPFDYVVVDEASMVDLPMMSHLLEALAPSTGLILLGDRDQLASVEVGSVLADLCDAGVEHGPRADFAETLKQVSGYDLSGYIEQDVEQNAAKNARPLQNAVVQLRVSHRFDANSGIGQLAKAVNVGDHKAAQQALQHFAEVQFHPFAKDEPIYWQQSAWQEQIKQGFKSYSAAVSQALRSELSADKSALQVFSAFDQFQVLVALRKGPYGVEQVNQQIVSLLRRSNLLPALNSSTVGRESESLWYAGRAIIVNQNNYDLGLYNGDIGIALPYENDQLKVAFLDSNGAVRWLLPSRIPAHETAFAITVHKSQGSEFTQLCLLLPDQWQNVITRELIYTAITRAKKRFTLFASQACWQQGVKSQVERASGLRDALWGD